MRLRETETETKKVASRVEMHTTGPYYISVTIRHVIGLLVHKLRVPFHV